MSPDQGSLNPALEGRCLATFRRVPGPTHMNQMAGLPPLCSQALQSLPNDLIARLRCVEAETCIKVTRFWPSRPGFNDTWSGRYFQAISP